MFKVLIGDILKSDADTIVNTVNCVGIMGKGIAKEFKEKYPEMFLDYSKKCQKKLVKPGEPFVFIVDNNKKIINFPTKDHWRSPSKIEYIEKGLEWFINNYQNLNITKIAFPPLGCGNGGLSWDIVGPLIYKKLQNLTIDVELYAPHGINKNKTTIDYLTKQNDAHDTNTVFHFNKKWLIPLQIVKMINESSNNINIGRVMFQKICYVLDRSGCTLGLTFTRGEYGPYSKEILNMISILSNNNLIYEETFNNTILLKITKNFYFDEKYFNQNDINSMQLTYNLFKRIQNSIQAELITTIIYSYDFLSQHNKDIDDYMIIEYILEWKNRYNNENQISKIKELLLSLTAMKMININFNDKNNETNFNLCY